MRLNKVLALPILLLLCASAHGQVNALSCSSTDVQNAINTATVGQTVNVPSGNCTWGLNSVALNKAITLNLGSANITMSAHPSFNVTKQASGVTRIQGGAFSAVGPETTPHFVTVNGPWPSGDPVIFQNIAVNVQGASMFDVFVAGGVIFSHIAFTGTWDNAMLTVKDLTHTASWTTADSLGMNDPTGKLNVYVEDSTFIGGSNGVVDCDDNSRCVWRHNSRGFNGQDGGGFNSHGHDSSPFGMRQFEIYNNAFTFPDKTCPLGNSSLSNINQFIWLRGATGVVFNNQIDHLSSQCWGTKAEVKLTNRGAEDDRPGGIPCGSDTYPVNHQIGQNNNGSSDFTDPIWFWGNTGTVIALSGVWSFGNPCGFDWNTYWQWGRDGINTSVATPVTLPAGGGSVTGIGGTPKPGYTAFTYPHPLISLSANIVVSPSPVAFGNQNVSTTSGPITATISNTGSAATTLGSPYFTITTGNSGDFLNTGGSCGSATPMPVGGSCTWIGTFHPTTVGAESSLLSIKDSTGTTVATATLTGTGTSVAIPVVTLGPRVHDFGTVNTGSASGNFPFVLTNSGTATLSSIAVVSSDPTHFPLNTNTCGVTLAPAASCGWNQTFSPLLVAGPQGASVGVTSNASSSVDTISVTGTGFTPTVNPPPAPAIPILTTSFPASRTVLLTITNPSACVTLMRTTCVVLVTCTSGCSWNARFTAVLQ